MGARPAVLGREPALEFRRSRLAAPRGRSHRTAASPSVRRWDRAAASMRRPLRQRKNSLHQGQRGERKAIGEYAKELVPIAVSAQLGVTRPQVWPLGVGGPPGAVVLALARIAMIPSVQ